MKIWGYGINSYYRTGNYWLDEAPWYVFCIDRLVERICDFVPSIPFPAIPYHDKDFGETNLKETYGNLQDWFHVKVHMPIFNWANKKIKTIRLDASVSLLRYFPK